MNDDLGGNTGEMGTVIRHVKESKLFSMVLEPLTEYLHYCDFVGDCNVNCIVDSEGVPWPLEFTVRLGWPDFCIRQEVIRGDPVQWMTELLAGRDSLETSTEVAAGIVLAHGDFPQEKDKADEWAGYPIEVANGVDRHVHWQQISHGRVPVIVNGRLKSTPGIVTAGQYVAVVSGAGSTVVEAIVEATTVAESVSWPSNVMRRTDIGRRLRSELSTLQQFGFAEGMRYE